MLSYQKNNLANGNPHIHSRCSTTYLIPIRLTVFQSFAIGILSLTSLLAQSDPPNKSYHYVWDTQPPDAYLVLRTQPNGQEIMKMPNGTLLEIIDRRDDGWWYVRVVSNGATGWALNQDKGRNRYWIYCCTAEKILE